MPLATPVSWLHRVKSGPYGHAMNNETSRHLFAGDVANDLDEPLARFHIERLIPHRDPFLFIDHVQLINIEHHVIEATRRIDPDDPVLKGHFPGNPIYPGALQLEGLFQTALVLMYFLVNRTTHPPSKPHVTHAVGTRVHDVCHPHAVRPGDVMTMRCRIETYDELLVTATVQAAVGNRIATVGSGEFCVL